MIGQVIQNYKIESILGEGGMGVVYLASHTLLNRKAAIKALSPLLAANNDLKMRFYKEASTMSNLKHPNIVTLYDYIEDMGNLYLVMEYIDGVPLDKYVKNYGKPLPEDKIIHFFSQILDAFEYAHSKKVIHRDIKPANIIISNDDTVKVLDFGIAKLLDETSEKLTQTGSKVGTVTFMSPEQVKALPVDNRSDIYSLGVAMYQIATGKCPYEDLGSEYEIYNQIVHEPLPDPKKYNDSISEKIINIISKATKKEASERFQSCIEFKTALLAKENFSEKTHIIAPPIQKNPETYKPEPLLSNQQPLFQQKINQSHSNQLELTRYAGFWLRFFALIIDTIILSVAMFIILVILIIIFPTLGEDNNEQVVYILIPYIIGIWLYFAFLESSDMQGTIGKKAVGIKVVDINGAKINFGKASARFFAKILSSFVFNIGFIIAGFTPKKQALHDLICNCIVIKKSLIL